MNQIEFAKITGIDQSHLSKVINGSKTLSGGIIEKILNVFPNVNINRIYTGFGPVLIPQDEMHVFVEEPVAPYGNPLVQARQHLKLAIDLLDHCQNMPDGKEK